MTFVSITRSLNGNDDPHEVTFGPRELHPFLLRFRFRVLENDEGVSALHMVESPHLIERSSPPIVLHAITDRHLRALEENRERYRRMAEALFDMRVGVAHEERKTMLEAARSGGRPTAAYLVDLANDYRALLAERGRRDVINTLARRRHIPERTIQRHLDNAEKLGILPRGIRPRKLRAS